MNCYCLTNICNQTKLIQNVGFIIYHQTLMKIPINQNFYNFKITTKEMKNPYRSFKNYDQIKIQSQQQFVLRLKFFIVFKQCQTIVLKEIIHVEKFLINKF
ncbi:hypothetical protein pb186bvf_001821 [Paramecium bursaria]